MSRRLRSRHIEIFNFSFLDILACTIGLLIFIMVMVFILQAGSPVADAGAVSKSQASAARVSNDAKRDNEIADTLESQIAKIHSPIDQKLLSQHDSAAKRVTEARAQQSAKTRKLTADEAALAGMRRAEELAKRSVAPDEARAAAAQARLDRAEAAAAELARQGSGNNVHFLPHAHSAVDAGQLQILHVDCRANDVLLLEIAADGSAREIGRSPVGALNQADSDFARTIDAYQRRAKPLVLFWVRPDGMQTFSKAISALPDGMTHGYEPADADWSFGQN